MFIARILFHKYAVAIYDNTYKLANNIPYNLHGSLIRKYLYCDIMSKFVDMRW